MPTSCRLCQAAAVMAVLSLCLGVATEHSAAEDVSSPLVASLESERQALEAETVRLQSELQSLQQVAQASTDSDPIAPTVAARFELRLNALEEALRRTTGMVETFDFRLQQLDARLTSFDERLLAAERGLMEAQSSPEAAIEEPIPEPEEEQTASLVPQSATSNVELPEGTPEEQYNFAFGLLRQAKYADAQSALEQFLAGHAKHDLAGNAKYWLGETFYVRGDYQSSALIFAEAYREYPDSQKAPDNLLKLGMSLGNLGDKENACGTLSELLRIYPRAASSIKARAEREMQNMECP